jgi:hypothetical protein
LKVIDIGIGEVFVTVAAVELTVTVGAVTSYVTDRVDDAALPFPAVSFAAS